MAIKIHSTKNAAINGVKCLVYGKSGIGKTTLMATAPKPFILSCESGMLALKDSDIPYTKITSIADIDEVYEYLKSREARRKYKTICLDSISEIAEVVLAEFIKKKKDNRAAYMAMQQEMEPIVKKFRDLRRRNVVFSAKRKRVEDSDSGMTQYIASMPGKYMLEFLPYQFDEVFYMDLHEGDNGRTRRVLHTEPGFEHDAKDRSGVLAKMERPNLTRIFDKIMKKKGD